MSAKISIKLRAKMRRLGIKPSLVFKEAIEDALTRQRLGKLKVKLKIAQELARKMSVEDIVRDIREGRDSR
ncbi:MAG: hypothetical protein ACREBF_03775 [Candidatus Micrarchaeales archaeon]